jgi:hypothetical protein
MAIWCETFQANGHCKNVISKLLVTRSGIQSKSTWAQGFHASQDSIRASAWRTLTGAQDQLHLPNDRKLTVETIVGRIAALLQ